MILSLVLLAALAAGAFLAALSPEQRQWAAFPFEAEERFGWNFVPSEVFPRNGPLVRDMTTPQRARAHDLEKGGEFVRDPDGYPFSIFGTPGAGAT